MDLGHHEFENWTYKNGFRVSKDSEGNLLEVSENVVIRYNRNAQ